MYIFTRVVDIMISPSLLHIKRLLCMQNGDLESTVGLCRMRVGSYICSKMIIIKEGYIVISSKLLGEVLGIPLKVVVRLMSHIWMSEKC